MPPPLPSGRRPGQRGRDRRTRAGGRASNPGLGPSPCREPPSAVRACQGSLLAHKAHRSGHNRQRLLSGRQAWLGQGERLLHLKFGLTGVTQALAAEGKPHGIRACVLHSGGMATRWGAWSRDERVVEGPEPLPATGEMLTRGRTPEAAKRSGSSLVSAVTTSSSQPTIRSAAICRRRCWPMTPRTSWRPYGLPSGRLRFRHNRVTRCCSIEIP